MCIRRNVGACVRLRSVVRCPLLVPPPFVLLPVVLRVPGGAVLPRVFAGCPPPPRRLWCPLLCFVVPRIVWRRGLWCVFVMCPVVCGVLVSGQVLAPCCLARCGAGPCCAVFVLLCCPALLCSLLVLGSGLVPGCFCFCALLVRCCASVPASLLSVRCSPALAAPAAVLCCCLLCLRVCCWAWLSSVVSWWVLVAPGVVFRWCAVVCPWVLCCAVLLCAVPPGVASLCTVLFRFAPFGAAARCVVSWGAVRRPRVLSLLAPCFVLSFRAVCVSGWCGAAWCCSPLCFLPCAPCGVVLCVSCRLRPERCCCVARSPSMPRGGVVSCPAALLGVFLALVWFYLLENPLQNLLKCVFLAFENKVKLYTTQHTRLQQDHVRFSVLRGTRCS